MPEHKNQHYVPEFYLKRFSPDEDEKTISLWNLASNRKIIDVGLRGQCARDYFYGKDLLLEKSFGHLEGQMGKLFQEIDETSSLPSHSSDKHALLLFHLITQWTRTKYMADAMSEITDKLIANLFRSDEKGGKRYKDDLARHIENPVHLPIRIATALWPMAYDLRYKLLRNCTQVEFLTSDNPVIMSNQLFSFVERDSTTGLAVKGLQVFFPMDPARVLVLYDAAVYSVGERNRQIVEIRDLGDIDQINQLQVCNCQNNVYFRNASLHVDSRYRRSLRFRRESMTRLDSYEVKKTAAGSEELIASSLNDVRTNLDLSCIRIKRRARRWRASFLRKRTRPVFVPRNKWAHDEFRKHERQIRNQELPSYWLFQHLCAKGVRIPASRSRLRRQLP